MKIIILFLVFISSHVYAECGTGITDEIVPDGWMSASFRSACEQHDICYETCGIDRHHCDLVFHHNMKISCRNSYGSFLNKLKTKICLEIARNFFRAVVRWGDEPFSEIQRSCY